MVPSVGFYFSHTIWELAYLRHLAKGYVIWIFNLVDLHLPLHMHNVGQLWMLRLFANNAITDIQWGAIAAARTLGFLRATPLTSENLHCWWLGPRWTLLAECSDSRLQLVSLNGVQLPSHTVIKLRSIFMSLTLEIINSDIPMSRSLTSSVNVSRHCFCSLAKVSSWLTKASLGILRVAPKVFNIQSMHGSWIQARLTYDEIISRIQIEYQVEFISVKIQKLHT